jgi:hypothetical protein
MNPTNVSEFPAFERVTQAVDNLVDPHRQRQVCAFLAARYGWNLQPSAKKLAANPNPNNRSEFAAIETTTEELDPLTPDQQRQAVALLGARYSWKITQDYKPPAGGFTRKRKFSKG